VERALRGEVLDHLMMPELFPGGTPELWRDWPLAAREAWDDAAHRFTMRFRALSEQHEGRPLVDRREMDHRRQYRRREHVRLTLAQAWSAVEASMAHPDPRVRLTWLDLTLRLAALVGGHPIVRQRAAQHQIRSRLGFEFGGRPGVRRILRAPCIVCGEVVEAREIEDRTCGGCQRRTR